MGKVIIVVPVYKKQPDEQEIISLQQCFKVLHNYPVSFVHSEQLGLQYYQAIAAQETIHAGSEPFDPVYFEGIAGYNKLLLSPGFYKRFEQYTYILIYQADCFVFRDELNEWCDKGYDYIGAPWVNIELKEWLSIPGLYPVELKWFHRLFNYTLLKKAGNGGLSLRKTRSFLNNLALFEKQAKKWKGNEDSFFSHYIGTFNPFFRIPGIKTALQFGFDAFPEYAYQLNNQRLPFGCHAWYRNTESFYNANYAFWKPFIAAHLQQE